MRSRVGYKPKGILTVVEPKKHFQESDFIKAIDSWSEGLQDNPVPHFAAKIALPTMELNQLESMKIEVFAIKKKSLIQITSIAILRCHGIL